MVPISPLLRRSIRRAHSLATSAVSHDPTVAIPAVLSSSASRRDVARIHAHMLQTDFLSSFPFPFHYNNLIRAYTRLDDSRTALHVYVSMCRDAVEPDRYTVPIALKAAGQCFHVAFGRMIHGTAIKLGLSQNEFCESGFISLYSKAGELRDAIRMFDGNPDRKLGSWNSILAGLTQGGRAEEAISMFLEMKELGFLHDDVTMVSVVSACGALGDLNLALQLHKCVFQAAKSSGKGKSDVLMLNSVIDMYGKCGRMDLARKVFLTMGEMRNVSSWTSMIVGYGSHGLVREALNCFDDMIRDGVVPNHVTFVGVLIACVHGGLVEQGRRYLDMMNRVYGIAPNLQHYGCLVDLLGRAGLFKEAKEVIETMPVKPNSVIFGCLMGACEKFENVGKAEWVAQHLVALEPQNDGVYVVLSNIYASKNMWGDVERMRVVMKNRQLEKVPGYSLATH